MSLTLCFLSLVVIFSPLCLPLLVLAGILGLGVQVCLWFLDVPRTIYVQFLALPTCPVFLLLFVVVPLLPVVFSSLFPLTPTKQGRWPPTPSQVLLEVSYVKGSFSSPVSLSAAQVRLLPLFWYTILYTVLFCKVLAPYTVSGVLRWLMFWFGAKWIKLNWILLDDTKYWDTNLLNISCSSLYL